MRTKFLPIDFFGVRQHLAKYGRRWLERTGDVQVTGEEGITEYLSDGKWSMTHRATMLLMEHSGMSKTSGFVPPPAAVPKRIKRQVEDILGPYEKKYVVVLSNCFVFMQSYSVSCFRICTVL